LEAEGYNRVDNNWSLAPVINQLTPIQTLHRGLGSFKLPNQNFVHIPHFSMRNIVSCLAILNFQCNNEANSFVANHLN